MLVEQRIVPHAQTYNDIKFGTCLLQKTRLHDGIAQDSFLRTLGYMNLEVRAMIALDFASNAIGLEPCVTQNARKDTRFVEHYRAGRQADLLDTKSTRKFDDLLHTREVGAKGA